MRVNRKAITAKKATYCIQANLRTSDVGGENLEDKIDTRSEYKIDDRETSKRIKRTQYIKQK